MGLTWLRITLPLLDIENTAKDFKEYENALTLIFLGRSQNMFQIMFNFSILADDPKLFKYLVLTTIITATTQSYAVLAFTQTQVNMENVANRAIVGGCFRVIFNIFICQKALRFMRSDII